MCGDERDGGFVTSWLNSLWSGSATSRLIVEELTSMIHRAVKVSIEGGRVRTRVPSSGVILGGLYSIRQQPGIWSSRIALLIRCA